MTTSELAKQLRNKPESIHRRYCLTGSYYGIKPQKLLNGRLLWPDDAVQRLTQPMSSADGGDHAAA